MGPATLRRQLSPAVVPEHTTPSQCCHKPRHAQGAENADPSQEWLAVPLPEMNRSRQRFEYVNRVERGSGGQQSEPENEYEEYGAFYD